MAELGSGSIYVVVEVRGDGYGHNTEEPVGWSWAEKAADDYAAARGAESSTAYYRTVQVPWIKEI